MVFDPTAERAWEWRAALNDLAALQRMMSMNEAAGQNQSQTGEEECRPPFARRQFKVGAWEMALCVRPLRKMYPSQQNVDQRTCLIVVELQSS